ncbi:MAG: hypothetical protein R3325_04830 [Thermoanaerobaculia bacterium]|nr:hypothetical protein [Thermoanaerobaculia bacterium]
MGAARRPTVALLLLLLLALAPVAGQEPEPAPPAESPAVEAPAPAPLDQPPAEPQDEASEASLLERLEIDFRVLKLRRGVVLEPREEVGIRAIEVSADGLAADGAPVTASELAARLGPAGDAVRELAEMSPAELTALLEGEATGVIAVSEPEAPAPPAPPRPPRQPRRRAEADVVFGSDLTVEKGETRREVVVFGGELTIEGTVLGDAVAIAGEAWVNGRVTGDLAVVASEARIGPEAVIEGELVNIGSELEVDEAAQILGAVVDVPFSPALRFDEWPGDFGSWWRFAGRGWGGHRVIGRTFDLLWSLFGLVVLGLLACLALLLAPGPVRRIGQRAGEEPWQAGLVGLLAQILFLPLFVTITLILLVSVIGIPLLLLVPFALLALALVAFLGYTGVALRLGEWLRERFGWGLSSPYVVLLVGVVSLQIWWFLGEALTIGGGPLRAVAALFLLFGGLLQWIAWTIGFGAALLSRFGSRRSAAVAPPPPAPGPAADEEHGWALDVGPEETPGESAWGAEEGGEEAPPREGG